MGVLDYVLFGIIAVMMYSLRLVRLKKWSGGGRYDERAVKRIWFFGVLIPLVLIFTLPIVAAMYGNSLLGMRLNVYNLDGFSCPDGYRFYGSGCVPDSYPK